MPRILVGISVARLWFYGNSGLLARHGRRRFASKVFESAAAIGCVRLKNIMEMVSGDGVYFVCKFFFFECYASYIFSGIWG